MIWQHCQRITRARFARTIGIRTVLATPLLREGILSGLFISAAWKSARSRRSRSNCSKPSPTQAVIAIENVRLFQELKESLEQQTATSEILGVIASSPTDIQPVLDVVAKNAARLGGAADAEIRLVDGDGTATGGSSYGSKPGAKSIYVPTEFASDRGPCISESKYTFDDLRATIEAEVPKQDNFSGR